MSPQDPASETPDGHTDSPDPPASGADQSPQPPPAPEAGGQGEEPTAEPADELSADEPEANDFTPEQVDALVAQRDDYLDQLQRKHAELENFRKQSQKRIADEGARALAAFVERLLPVLDAIEAAQAHGSTDIDAVATHLIGFLEKEGLERVSPTGEAFDPNVAEAVMHEPGEGDGGPVVTEVLRTGYLWNGRVIRAAMVKVAG